MTDLPDYYAILGVEPTSNQDEIRAAYRRLAMQHHPDVNPPDQDHAAANAFMCRLNEAYATLSDPGRRATYDRQRRPHTVPPRSQTWWRAEPAGSSPTGTRAWQEPNRRHGFYHTPTFDWLDSYMAVEERLKMRLQPFLTFLSMIKPVLVVSALIVAGFWAYVEVRADPQSWALLTYLVDISGGIEGLITSFAMLSIIFAACLVWWRSLLR